MKTTFITYTLVACVIGCSTGESDRATAERYPSSSDSAEVDQESGENPEATVHRATPVADLAPSVDAASNSVFDALERALFVKVTDLKPGDCGIAHPTKWSSVTNDERRGWYLEAVSAIDPEHFLTGPPGHDSCGLTVHHRCGPDLDGDGASEILARFERKTWLNGVGDYECSKLQKMYDDGTMPHLDFWPTRTFVVLKETKKGWISSEPFFDTFFNGGNGLHDIEVSGFVQLLDGRKAIVVRTYGQRPGDGSEFSTVMFAIVHDDGSIVTFSVFDDDWD